MHTADQVKAHAAERVLVAIDFLDRTGSRAGTLKRCKVVRLRFDDGTALRTTPATMREVSDFGFILPTDELNAEHKAFLAELEAVKL